MYDKFSLILRIETTVNDVSFFKHYREVEHRDGSRETKWGCDAENHLQPSGPAGSPCCRQPPLSGVPLPLLKILAPATTNSTSSPGPVEENDRSFSRLQFFRPPTTSTFSKSSPEANTTLPDSRTNPYVST
jgi:hypothetical protein